MSYRGRFWSAMAIFVVLGALEWVTLSPETIRVVQGLNGQPLRDVSGRGVALALLGVFALRSWFSYRSAGLDPAGRSQSETRRSGRE